ncbi:MAG: type II toxin-antitoxin system VapC family toxin [Candidatus Njordarchaeia archaeon]
MKVFVDSSLIIYMNVPLSPEDDEKISKFFKKVLKMEAFTDLLVLDETIYVSKKKYDVSYDDTLEFLDKAILPYVKIIPLTELEYVRSKTYMLKYRLKPSDAIHLAAMDKEGIPLIATEDKDFNKTHVKRIWL